jgi:cobalt-zinc-cadmium efflux system protein
MSGDHIPAAVANAGSRHKQTLIWVLGLVVAFMVAEVVTSFLTDSLALLSDAGHMATDALGLGMSVAAIIAASRAGDGTHRTFGLYRLEILAALGNAVLLFAVAGFVLYEAVRRFHDPHAVLSGPMLVVAVLGLAVNAVSWWLLREGAGDSINVEGAYLEVVADLIGSLGVIAAALLTRFAQWPYADPLFGAAIGVFILPRAWHLGGRSLRILLQAAPDDIDVDQLRLRLAELATVQDVHDLHVWTLTSGMNVASAHLMIPAEADPHTVLDQARQLLETDYAIDHATLQVEPDTHRGCADVTW